MIAKMRLINLTADKEQLDDILARFVNFRGFHPVESEKIISSVHGAIGFEQNNPTDELLSGLKEMESKTGLTILPTETNKIRYTLDDMHQFFEKAKQLLTHEFDEIKLLKDKNEELKELLEQIKNFENLDIPFETIFNTKFLSLRIGKIPVESLEHINYYHKPFIFHALSEDRKSKMVWCMYLTTNDFKREMDNVFTSMNFQRVYLPSYIHGTARSESQELLDIISSNETEIIRREKKLHKIINRYVNKLSIMKGELMYLHDIYEVKKSFVNLSDRVLISGFIEEKNVKKFNDLFNGIDSIQIVDNDANADSRFKPPTKFKNNFLTRPFQVFVEMYGVPSYGNVDPTAFMAISYTILFGIMFGDLGQGLLLSLIGYLLGKFKGWSLGPIVTRIGFSSAFFGVLYGEFFGTQEFLKPLYGWLGIDFLPFHGMDSSNTMTLLLGAVALGAAFLLVSIIVNTTFKFRHKEYAEAICSPNGVSGIMFYGFILVGVALEMLLGVKNVFNIFTIILMIVIPLILIFLKEPLERIFKKEAPFPNGVGGFIIEGIFELIEVLLSYVTNTLSFLRVGGFVLAHAGLMMVVNVLSNDGENITVMVIGNLFVMGLEGLIVGIQVLRLEFYELFSRYYDGSGILFNPIFKEEV